jgi:bifunctional non-homologous end joining protein LigD
LKGEWVLVRGSREPKQWIFFKVRDEFASPEMDITEHRPESVVSGKLVDEIGEQSDSKQWVTPIERELEKYRMKDQGRSPIPKKIQPMLATLVEKPFNGKDWVFELKMDGIRALIVKDGTKLDMWTRNAKDLTRRFPTLAEAVSDLPVDSAILDGEIVALDEKGQAHFNLIQPRIHLTRSRDIALADEQIPVYFYAFDLLYINGYNLMKFPLLERKAVLKKLLENSNGWVRFTDHIEEEGVSFFNVVSKHGLEGIVAKLKSSQYQQARSKYWLKMKTQQTDHFVVGGFTAPEGSRKYFGALLLGLYRNGELIHVGRTGGGFDDATLAETHKKLKPLVTTKSPFKEVPAEVRR